MDECNALLEEADVVVDDSFMTEKGAAAIVTANIQMRLSHIVCTAVSLEFHRKRL